MRKSAFAWVVVTGLLGACSSGDDGSSPSASPPSRGAGESTDDAQQSVDVDYQFVETAGGMTVEAITEGQVQTFSCPGRSCTGLCDECAASACRASGGLAGACRAMVDQCNDSCTCAGIDCGLPVCGVNLGGINVCMISNERANEARTPVPDATPLDPAARPASSSNVSSSSAPAF